MERDLSEIKEEVRARTDIVEIIGGHTRLKRSGKNWTGLCPFHNDRKPSFSVVPDLGIYRCWSCGEKGDVFTFVQKKENLEFIEALEWLARRAGIPFDRKGVSPERASEREQALELNSLAVRFFQDRLSKSQEARDYLANRAILKTTQEQWDLGYAPPDWDSLTYFLQERRANLELAAKIGLVRARKQEGSGYYDFYRSRIMFPIHDTSGNVIAFGGRVMNPQDEPKYLNSSDSFLFPKSRTLYGFYFAKKKLSGDTPPVFVEGYLDVITAHQAGFAQCVATLGTSLTEDHARMLSRINPRVIICYDGDKAGINATLRGSAVWEELGIENAEVRVARLPKGEDPDSLLRKGETSKFQAALDRAIPRVEFQIELALQRHDLKTEQGRDSALAEAIPILASVRALTMRDRYAQRIAFLHPSHSHNLGRAIDQILADAETFARQNQNGHAPRTQGYPLTEQSNRGPLQETPPPPTYRPANAQQWGQASWPNTREVIRKGEGAAGGGKFQKDGGGKYGNGNWGRGRKKEGPPTDPTPPSLTAPALTKSEKAERQLLRALFSPEWRVRVLYELRVEVMVTDYGKRVLQWAARTPALPDGGLDPRQLLVAAEAEEEAELAAGAVGLGSSRMQPEAEVEAVISADGWIGQDESAWIGLQDSPSGGHDADAVAEADMKNAAHALSGRNSTKFSDFIRELLEESAYFVSNTSFNETTMKGCLGVLQQQRDEREMREIARQLESAQTPDERRAINARYHEKMRAMRGTPNRITDGQG